MTPSEGILAGAKRQAIFALGHARQFPAGEAGRGRLVGGIYGEHEAEGLT